MARALTGTLRAAEGLTHAVAALAAVLVVIGFVAVLVAVFYRYVLGTPLNGVDELTGYLVVGQLCCGLGCALLMQRHIGVDILTTSAGPGSRRALAIWSDFSVLVCAGLFTWSAWHTVIFNRDFGTYSTGPLEIQIWIAQAPMVLGGVVLGIAAIIRILRGLTGEQP